MGTRLRAAAACIIATAILVSCATSSEVSDVLVREDYTYAAMLAVGTAQDSAMSDIYNSVNAGQLEFLPPSVSQIMSKRSAIPGMNALVAIWNQAVSQHVMDNFESFKELTDSLIANPEYKNAATDALESGDSSGADTLILLYHDIIRDAVVQSFASFPMDGLEACIMQYNTWVDIQGVMNNRPVAKSFERSTEQLRADLADLVTDMYFSRLRSAEELYRTTPDPYADETAAKVFDLN